MSTARVIDRSVGCCAPHPTMPDLVLSEDETRNVVAYVLSLRR